jgi:hypothetical protein
MTSRVGTRCGAAGVLGALTCTLACCLPAILMALGVGAAGASMGGHDAHAHGAAGTPGSLLHLLHRISPVLLIVSIVLIAGAFALRRPVAVIPALTAGAVLYLSVHGQTHPAVMYAGMAVGYGTWIGLYLWTRPDRRSEPEDRRQCQQHDQPPHHMGQHRCEHTAGGAPFDGADDAEDQCCEAQHGVSGGHHRRDVEQR